MALSRLHVHEKGLYSVTFEELFSRPRPFDATSLALTRLGEPVAFHVEPDPNIFQRGSVLYFLSDGAELNPYGTEAVYELAIEPGAGRPMNIVSAAPSGLPVVVFYIESRRFLIRDSPRPATTYEQKTGGADGVKGA